MVARRFLRPILEPSIQVSGLLSLVGFVVIRAFALDSRVLHVGSRRRMLLSTDDERMTCRSFSVSKFKARSVAGSSCQMTELKYEVHEAESSNAPRFGVWHCAIVMKLGLNRS